ncbi:hypothetical protein IMX26_12735 [Clostridium sp. 'deep sea']|uniref:hypothetical protein n=1 Tax=Clostridium sp. 'deep sea' TaxID=2779445 RepID=UPI001896A32E|nr:hypothetical protein [Clostridium sp. 'deep sea']QOR34350.1 hypothetical protein IMX26_12735 [Clostridium sp. 'deep sea']
MKNVNSIKNDESNLLPDILRFYVPLGIYSMIMLTSHSVINAGVSRTNSPQIALAAYALTMSIMNMFASPAFTSRQMLVAMARDKKSFRLSLSLMIKLGIASLAILGLLAFTPLGEFVFLQVFKAPTKLFPEIKSAAKFCLLLPFIYTLRAYSQGVLMVQKKTKYLTYSVVVRIIFMVFLASFLPKIKWLNGAAVGILIWTLGMSCEAILNFLWSIPQYKKLPEQSETDTGKSFSVNKAFSFLWPLMLMSFVWTLGKPLINFGLSKTTDPEKALATFQVAQSFAWILMGFLENNIRQVSLIFGTTKDRIKYLKKFTLVISIILACLLSLLALTPLGQFTLLNIIKVSPELASASKGILILLIASPLILAWNEFYIGLLMTLNNTKILSVAKITNMTTVTITILTLAAINPAIGAIAGAIGTLVGLLAELIVLRFAYLKLAKLKELKQVSK